LSFETSIAGKNGRSVGHSRNEAELEVLLRDRLASLMAPFRPRAANFAPPPAAPVHTVQDAILEVAQRLDHPDWVLYLVGGTLRDLLVGINSDGHVEPRDVDVIVRGATGEELRACLEGPLVVERLTRFGGLHLSRKLSSGERVLFDVWSLEDTWGFQSQKISPSIERFPATTFLNIDSCAIELLAPQKRQRCLFEQGFFAAIAHRALDINYAPNPYPHICAARALLIAARLDFSLSRRLAEFILEYALDGVERFVEAQSSHYGSVRAHGDELLCWLESIRVQLVRSSQAIRITVSDARRKELADEDALRQRRKKDPA
jgi:hypothetical protein